MAEFYTNPAQFIREIDRTNFDAVALQLFQYQYSHNSLYRSYCQALGRDPECVSSVVQIPFLPISFFKSHPIINDGGGRAELIFESSGTTGEVPSRHYILDVTLYQAALTDGFTAAFGAVSDWTFLALLPSYLERGNSSLVHMATQLMSQSRQVDNGFYLDDWSKLADTLKQLKNTGKKVLLLGVTFALLDFAQAYPMDLNGVVVMETGGMKGRREEWTRQQVHDFLKKQWQLSAVATEYGMTELLSQAYARADGRLQAAKTMKVFVREENDPLSVFQKGRGVLNIVDLANVQSCAFIATEDLGRLYPDGSFEVLGRLDHSALRGCSLMAL